MYQKYINPYFQSYSQIEYVFDLKKSSALAPYPYECNTSYVHIERLQGLNTTRNLTKKLNAN